MPHKAMVIKGWFLMGGVDISQITETIGPYPHGLILSNKILHIINYLVKIILGIITTWWIKSFCLNCLLSWFKTKLVCFIITKKTLHAQTLLAMVDKQDPLRSMSMIRIQIMSKNVKWPKAKFFSNLKTILSAVIW